MGEQRPRPIAPAVKSLHIEAQVDTHRFPPSEAKTPPTADRVPNVGAIFEGERENEMK